MIRKYFRLRRRLVVGLALAAVTSVPVAQATPNVGAGNVDRQDVTLVGITQGQWDAARAAGGLALTPVPSALKSKAASHGVEVVSEHGQTSPQLSQLQVEGMRWQAMADAYRQPSLIRSENSYGASKPSPTQAPVLAVSSPGGFDWADASIGASIGFGAVLLLLASVVVGRRTRSRFDPTGLTSA
jgi:hypothetical protein